MVRPSVPFVWVLLLVGAVRAQDGAMEFDVLIDLGARHLAEGRYVEATRAFEKALEADPSRAHLAWERLGDAHHAVHLERAAVEAWLRGLDRLDATPSSDYREAAARLLDKAIDLILSDISLGVDYGKRLEALDKRRAALSDPAAPDPARAQRLLEEEERRLEEHPASDVVGAVFDADRRTMEITLADSVARADALLAAGRAAEAIPIYWRLAQEHGERFELWERLGEACRSAGRTEDAAAYYGVAIRLIEGRLQRIRRQLGR